MNIAFTETIQLKYEDEESSTRSQDGCLLMASATQERQNDTND